MFIRWCPISLGYFFQTALEVKELQDGRLVGNELECAMVRRMGGLEQSETQIYPKFIQKERKGTLPCLAGNAAVSFFFSVFEVWWHADSPWVAFWSCKYDQWSGDTKPSSCIGDCCGYFLFAWQHGISLCQVETPVTQSPPAFDSGGGLLEAFVKGSPEMIKRRCTSSSLPPDYDSMVM